jgi:hypothetical protein
MLAAKMNFSEAQKACQKEKSVLLVFDSRGEVGHFSPFQQLTVDSRWGEIGYSLPFLTDDSRGEVLDISRHFNS